MEELIIVGKVINFFGIKGELKVKSNFDKKERVFKIGNNILINNEPLKITSVRIHKNNYLIRVNDINDINLVTKYIGYNVYFKKSDLGLTDNEYILEELIGADVMDDNENIGKVIEIYTSSNMNYIKVKYSNKTYLIPLIDEYIDHFDRDTKIIYTNNGKSLCL